MGIYFELINNYSEDLRFEENIDRASDYKNLCGEFEENLKQHRLSCTWICKCLSRWKYSNNMTLKKLSYRK